MHCGVGSFIAIYIAIGVIVCDAFTKLIRPHIHTGVARPGPARACALPSTFQALPSSAQQTPCGSITN